jgi:hypothetical protein
MERQETANTCHFHGGANQTWRLGWWRKDAVSDDLITFRDCLRDLARTRRWLRLEFERVGRSFCIPSLVLLGKC